MELDTAVALLNWLPDIENEGSLDYVATGFPTAGDTIDNHVYLDDVCLQSFSVVVGARSAGLNLSTMSKYGHLVSGRHDGAPTLASW